MNSGYLESIVKKLNRRFEHVEKPSRVDSVEGAVQRLWHFLQGEPALVAVLAELHAIQSPVNAAHFWVDWGDGELRGIDLGSTPTEYARFLYDTFVLAREYLMRVDLRSSEDASSDSHGHKIVNKSYVDSHLDDLPGEACLKQIPRIASRFRDLLVERLEDHGTVLGAIHMYKHRCEWFHRKDLFDKYKSNTRSGERVLKSSLYEYLYDQGQVFCIEPSLMIGNPDLMITQKGSGSIIADAKILVRNGCKKKIRDGLGQVNKYLSFSGAKVGYLILYKLFPDVLDFNGFGERAAYPEFAIGNKRIVIIVVDLCTYDGKTASQITSSTPIEIQPNDFECRLSAGRGPA